MEIEKGLLGKNWEQCERDRNETREGCNNMKAHDKCLWYILSNFKKFITLL